MKNLVIIYLVLVNLIAYSQQKGVSPNEANISLTTGKTYAIVVGISDYQDLAIPDLRFADKDAEAFAQFLRSDAGGKLDDDHLKVLINNKATMAQFAISLDWLLENARENDLVYIYFSGHGDVEKKTITQPGYLLCWDAPSRVYLAGGALALSMFQEVISTLSTQNKVKVVVITDACHSGKLSGSSINGSQATAGNLAKQYANEIKLLSCQPDEFSIEGEQWGKGRGVFSFHLIEGLYGLADRNGDQSVTIGEISRYLEDHVTSEVAPQKQDPIIIGSKGEKLSIVIPSIVESIKKSKTGQVISFASIENRGIEDAILSEVDSAIKIKYQAFKKCLADKIFFNDTQRLTLNNKIGADNYFNELIKEPKLEKLYSSMRRNYAAALQDDAQQYINVWLKADVQELECMRKIMKKKLHQLPQQLQRAADLLGKDHYMYKALMARKLIFEGKIVNERIASRYEPVLARQCLEIYFKSLETEPDFPYTNLLISFVYANNLKMVDSAYYYAEQSLQFAPNWILPLTELAGSLISNDRAQMNLAKKLIDQAMKIDSTHGFVWSQLGKWYMKKKNYDSAFICFNKYEQLNGPKYPCWYNEIGQYYAKLKKFKEAEKYYKLGLELDSVRVGLLTNLGVVYFNTKNYIESERVYLKVLRLDSMDYLTWNNLGNLYKRLDRDQEAEKAYLKSISIVPTDELNWYNLGNLYVKNQRFDEAKSAYFKVLGINKNSIYVWNSLGDLYNQMAQNDSALIAFKIALSIDSTYKFANGNIGIIYYEKGMFQESEEALLKTIKLDSNYITSRYYLSLVYLETDRNEMAKKSITKLLSINPEYAQAYVVLADISIKEKNNEDAIKNLEAALKNKIKLSQLESDKNLKSLKTTSEWNILMKEYFPSNFKDK